MENLKCPDLECDGKIGINDLRKIFANEMETVDRYLRFIDQNRIEKDPLKL